MGSFIEEIEFIASSKHRVGVLEALAEGGHDRRDLESMTGAHSSTIGRVLSDFEERRWIERNGPTYELTPLGEYVADQFADLCDAMEIEGKLRAVWQWLPREMEGSPGVVCRCRYRLSSHWLPVRTPRTGHPTVRRERLTPRIWGDDIQRGCVRGVHSRGARRDGNGIHLPATCLSAIINWNPELFQQTANQSIATSSFTTTSPTRDGVVSISLMTVSRFAVTIQKPGPSVHGSILLHPRPESGRNPSFRSTAARLGQSTRRCWPHRYRSNLHRHRRPDRSVSAVRLHAVQYFTK